MKKKIRILAGIFYTVLILFSCSTPAYVQQSEGVKMSSYKTYMWVDTRSSENDESKRATAFADISIHNAVNAELSKWGWKEVSDDPDVLISYDVFVERTTQQQQEAVYSQPYTRYYYNTYRKRWSTIYYPSQFMGYQVYETPVKEATVTITMLDAKTDKKIWQGWTIERLTNSGITNTDIKKSVRNIFKEASG